MPAHEINSSSLEQWIIGSRNGDEQAQNKLAEYLLPKAFEFAKHRMRNWNAMDDFEDVALSAVKSICLRLRDGEKKFLGEKELGSLLKRFIIGKIRDRRKYHLAEKRDVKLTVGDQMTARNKSGIYSPVQENAVDEGGPVWLDEQSAILSVDELSYLERMLAELGKDVQGLFSELVKRLDEKPRNVLMLITTGVMSNKQLADALECAPASVERYRQAIRRKLEEIVNE